MARITLETRDGERFVITTTDWSNDKGVALDGARWRLAEDGHPEHNEPELWCEDGTFPSGLTAVRAS